jgi:hypothetical protein
VEIRHISLHTSLPPLSKPPPGVWRCRAPTHWVGRADVRRSWRRNSQWILGGTQAPKFSHNTVFDGRNHENEWGFSTRNQVILLQPILR